MKQAAASRTPSKAPETTTPGDSTVEARAAGSLSPPKGEDQRLAVARERARIKEALARQAGDRAEALTVRVDALRHAIELEQKLFSTLKQRSELARQEQLDLEKAQAARRQAGAPEAELVEGRDKIAAAAQRFAAASAELHDSMEHLNELQGELTALQAEQVAAAKEAEQKKREADAAEQELSSLQNPFTFRNIAQWILDHGPRLVVIVIGMWLLNRVVGLCGRRIVRYLAERVDYKRVNTDDRAETLVGVFRNFATLIIVGGGTLMLLDEVGIPIVPLMGSAAVFGLAVAFGAQNLIRDYFAGFMVLLEDQYGVNDVIRINGMEGKVERISLRMTVLRDAEGAAHFIPHGTITSVTNMTHSWARAFFTIGVAYKEDADRVMEVLLALARELSNDPVYGEHILEDPEMLGVDAFGDSSVNIKFFLKTRPMKQWMIKREMLRRIKRRFDEMGIEIPFPQRTVYHRYESGEPRRDGRDMSGYAA